MLKGTKAAMVRTFPRMARWYWSFLASRSREASSLRTARQGFRFAGNDVMTSEAFEPGETTFVTAQLARADVFVDIGANLGFYTCLARCTGRRVVAIEASRDNVEGLLFNLGANGWLDVEVVPMGLAERIGVASLHGRGTAASLLPDWGGAPAASGQLVPVTTLDAVVGSRFAGQAMLIKMDVEGAELGVLRGAAAILTRRPRPVWLVEVCLTENHPAGLNPDFAEIFDTFWAHGYEATALLPDGTRRPVEPAHVCRWTANGKRDFGYVSYVFEVPGP